MRPFLTPSENRIGSRAATPGMPFGTQRNEVRPFGWLLPASSSNRNGQWSEEKVWNTPPISPRPIARRRGADIFRAGEVHVEPFEILGGQHEVLRTGLGIDLQPPSARPFDL